MLCNIIGHWLHLTPKQIEEITLAGLLHDIGKLRIDKAILKKPSKLSDREFNEIKLHPVYGYDLIKHMNISENIKLGVLLHHEKMDGSGYPYGYKETNINDFAKIISIADIYDAMTSDRSYHKKYSPFTVISTFEHDSYGILDTKFLFVFLQNIAHNYLGTKIKLSNGQIGKVVFIHDNSPSRPIVQIGNTMLDLLLEPSIDIEEIL